MRTSNSNIWSYKKGVKETGRAALNDLNREKKEGLGAAVRMESKPWYQESPREILTSAVDDEDDTIATPCRGGGEGVNFGKPQPEGRKEEI